MICCFCHCLKAVVQGTRCHSSASGRCRTRPAACSTSFPTVSSSPAPSPSARHSLRHLINATTTRHPPWRLQAQDKHAALHAQLGRTNQHILPLTHTLTHTHCLRKCACAAYANVLTKHARPSICQVGKESSAHFLVDTLQLTSHSIASCLLPPPLFISCSAAATWPYAFM